MNPPIRFAITVAQKPPKQLNTTTHIANTGVDNCHLSKYSMNLFINILIFNYHDGGRAKTFQKGVLCMVTAPKVSFEHK